MPTRSPRRGDATSGATAAPLRDDPARARLSTLLTDSTLSVGQFARAIGRDERSVRRWLAGQQSLPETLAEWLASVVRVEVTAERVGLVVRR